YNQTNAAVTINAYSGSIPMVGFGAAAYILALLDRQNVSPENIDCAASASPDAGTPSDLAPADLSMSPMMHSAPSGCGCAVGQAPLGCWWVVLLVLGGVGGAVALSRRRGRASRGRDPAAG